MAILPPVVLLCLWITVPSLAQPSSSLYSNARFFGAVNFTNYLTKATLDQELKAPGNLTVFVPVDEAFTALPTDILQRLDNDATFLREVLNYHIVQGFFVSPSFSNEQLLPAQDSKNVRINHYTVDGSGVITASGSSVLLVDIVSNNGILFLVDKVLYPAPTGTTLDYISAEPTMSTLLLAVVTAGLSDLFSNGNVTLFAPSNDAFARLPAGELNSLLGNITQLEDVLMLHMVNTGTYYSPGLPDGQILNSVSGQSLTISNNDTGLFVDGSHISTKDITVTNGVVHVIDRVLLPTSPTLRGKKMLSLAAYR